jgi:cytochrome c553
MITRISFLAPQPLERRAIVVPGLGHCFVRAMSAGERDEFEVAHSKSKNKDFRARLVACTVCDDDGSLVFSTADIPALSALPAATLQPLVVMAVEVNRLSEADVADLEAAGKNSSGDRSGNSSSDSPLPSVAQSPNSKHLSPIAS